MVATIPNSLGDGPPVRYRRVGIVDSGAHSSHSQTKKSKEITPIKKIASTLLAISILISPFSPLVQIQFASAGSFVDNSIENFSLGEHENTENVANAVRLKAGHTSGQFTSQVFDAGGWVHLDNMSWIENEPFLLVEENDNVGAEPETLVDGSSRKGEVLGGSILDLRALDGIYENIGENVEDNRLNWEHKIENVALGFENYTVKITGLTGGDSENVEIYIWENESGTWEFIDNLTSTEKTIEWVIAEENIQKYLVDNCIYIRYLENNSDTAQTWVAIDLCIVVGSERLFSHVKLQVRASSDNVLWSDWTGPSGDNTTFFTSPPADLTSVLDRRYYQYRVYFTSPSPSLSGEAGPTFGEIIINYTPVSPPALLSPANNSWTSDNTPTFDWTDVEDAAEYHLLLDNNSNFSSPEINVAVPNSQYTPANALPDDSYYWKVRAKVGSDLSTSFSSTWILHVDTLPPAAPALLSPENNSLVLLDQPTFHWTTVVDPHQITYRLVIDNNQDFLTPVYFKTGILENVHTIENKLIENFSPYYWMVVAIDNIGNENASENWTFTLKVPPSSSVNPISPYWTASAPITISINASDNDGTIENVELWYRYSADNHEWGEWIFSENRSSPPYTFSFAFPDGQGHYEFYSIAWDSHGNRENAPLVADARCGFDNATPPSPVLLSPENNATVETRQPTLLWTSVTDVSGVKYDLIIDNESSLSLPHVYYLAEITENSHTVENLLEIGQYWWKVVAKDGAGNENFENVFTFIVRLWANVEMWVGTAVSMTAWSQCESWMATAQAPYGVYGYLAIESWVGTVTALPSHWTPKEVWEVAILSQPPVWNVVEMWSADAQSTPNWHQAELWSTSVATVAGWMSVESWSENITASFIVGWTAVETWTATALTQPIVGWSYTETWCTTILAEVIRPVLLSPLDGENVGTSNPIFDWEDNTLPVDNFEIQIDNNQDFSSPEKWENTGTVSQYSPGFLQDNLYWWRVRAWRTGSTGQWVSRRVRIDTVKPGKPTLMQPVPYENENDPTPNLRWSGPPENSYPISYNVQISTSQYFEPENVVMSEWITGENWEVPSGLEENVWYWWRVLAKDNAGNLGDSYSAPRAFKIDTLPPAPPSILWPDNDGWTSSQPNLKWASVEDNSRPVLYFGEISLFPDYSSPIRSIQTYSENWTVIPPLEEGTFYWRVRGRDNAGNWGNWRAGYRFRVDNTPPSTVELISPPDNGFVAAGTIIFSWGTASDTGSGVSGYWIQIDNGPDFEAPFVHENSNVVGTTYAHPLSTPGAYYWRVRAVDGAGNRGEWSENFGFAVSIWNDVEAWFATIFSGGTWFNTEVWSTNVITPVSWNRVESWSATLSGEWMWRAIESWPAIIATTAGWVYVEDWSWSAQTFAQWRSVELWNNSLTANIPAPSLISPLSGTNVDAPPTLRWENLPADNFHLQIDNDQNFTSPENDIAGLLENSYTPPAIDDGLWYWRVLMFRNDENGPWSEVWRFRVDRVAPERPTLLSPADWENLNDNTPLLVWQAPPENSFPLLYRVQIATASTFAPGAIEIDTGFTVTSESWEVPPENSLEDNVYYWRVSVMDNAVNEGAFSVYRKLRIDTLLPTIPTLISPGDGDTVNSRPNLSWTSVPENSLPVVYWVQVSDWSDFGYLYEDAHTTENSYTTQPLDEVIGTYYWRVSAWDNAGNWSGWSGTQWFIVQTRWALSETWSSTATTHLEYLMAESWSAVINSQSWFRPTESWSTSINAPAWFRLAESWSAAVTTSAWWRLVESWSAAVTASAWWRLVEGWSAAVTTSAWWRFVESWNVIINAPARFRLAESWSAAVTTSAWWRFVESWSAAVTASAWWRLVEGWSAAVTTSAWWRFVESWSAAVTTPVWWRFAEGWTSTINAPVPAPILVSPPDGLNTNDSSPELRWENLQPADNFHLQIDNNPDFSSPEVDNDNITENLFTVPPLPDNLYWWRVRAFRNNESSEWSEVWNFRIDNLAPDMPALTEPLPGENLNDNTPNLRWGAPVENSYPIRYRIQVATDKYFTNVVREENWTITDENWEVIPGLPDGTYYWRVAAKDNAGNFGVFSSPRFFGVDTVKPSIPTLYLPAHERWIPFPELSWTRIADNSPPILYNLRIAYDSDFSHLKVNLWTTENSWSGSLEEGTYWWMVQAKDGAGNLSGWSENRKFMVDNTPPTVPLLLKPENNVDINAGTITFEWQSAVDDGAGVANYWIQIDNEPDFDNSYLVHENKKVLDNVYYFTISESGIYYWRVKAIDNAGNAGEWSDNYILFIYQWKPIESWEVTMEGRSWWRLAETWEVIVRTKVFKWEKSENWSISIRAPFIAGWSLMESWQGEMTSVTAFWRNVETWKTAITARVIAPVLVYPSNGLNTRESALTFRWRSVYLGDNYTIQIDNKEPVIDRENDNVGAEPETLADGSSRKGEVLGGSILDLRALDGIYENIGENVEDNRLNWEHKIENVAPGFENYTLRIRGYGEGDNENIFVYIWENDFGTWRWRELGSLTTAEKILEWNISYVSLSKYALENSIYIRYLENTPDSVRTVLHLDLCVMTENVENLRPPLLIDAITVDNFYDYTVPDNGRYWWRVRATVQNIVGEWSNIWSVLVDTVPPQPPALTSPPDGENLNDNTPLLVWQAPPENSFPLKYLVQVATDPSLENIIREAEVLSTSWEVTQALSENVYYWVVVAKDNAGNIGSPSAPWQFRVDVTPPTIPKILTPENKKNLNDNTPLLDWENVWDASRPVVYRVQVAYDSAFGWIVSGCDVFVLEDNWTTPELISERIYYWRLSAYDNAGNWSGWSGVMWFRFDRSSPSPPSPLYPVENENTNDTTPVFSWAAPTENSHPILYYLAISDNSLFPYENENSGWISSTTWELTAPLADGVWYWRVKAKDNAGNEGENSITRSFRIDTLPPENVFLVSPDNQQIITDNTPLLKWNFGTDNSLPIKYKAVVARDVSFTENFSSEWIDNDNWEVPQGLIDNRYYWKVLARDNAGNIFETPPRWFIVENAPPFTPQLVSPANGIWENDNTPLLRWENAWDISSPVRYFVWVSTDNIFENIAVASGWIENENWEVPEENSLLDNVKYYWRVQAKDNTEKLSENSVTWWFIIDIIVPPKVDLWSPPNNSTFEVLKVTFTWEGIADNSGITYLIEIDNEPSFLPPLVDNITTTTAALPHYTFAKTGWYYWRVRATDGAKNIGEWSDAWVILIARWTFIERWRGMKIISQPAAWNEIEVWSVSIVAPSRWRGVEVWQSTMVGAVLWRTAESWTVTAKTRDYFFVMVERWENVATLKGYPIPTWKFIENWTGLSLIPLPRKFRFIESWSNVQMSSQAKIVDFVIALKQLPPEWRNIESFKISLRTRETMPGIPVTIGLVAPGATSAADFSEFNIPVVKIEITIKPTAPTTEIKPITLSAKAVSNIPELPPLPGEGYKFMEFGVGGVAPEHIQTMKVQFKIEKRWLSEIDEDSLSVVKFIRDWESIPFEFLREEQDYKVYVLTADVYSTFAIVGQKKVLPLQAPSVVAIPTREMPPPSPLGFFALLGIGGVALGLMFYKSVTRVKIERIEKELKKLQRISPEKIVIKRAPVRVSKLEKMQMKKIAQAIWGRPLIPKVTPVRERMVKPELVAVETLEKFIRERRKRAPKVAAEKVDLEKIRKKLSREEIGVFKRLEAFVGRRRKAARKVVE